MFYYDRIDISEGVDLAKSKECMIWKNLKVKNVWNVWFDIIGF